MAQYSPAHRRALIVEDEYLFAMSLTVDMQALGFDTCDVAATAQDAFLQAMKDPPDIVLMDVNLEGGREGIEAARWLRDMRCTRRLRHCIHRPRYRRAYSSAGARRPGDRKATLSRAPSECSRGSAGVLVAKAKKERRPKPTPLRRHTAKLFSSPFSLRRCW